MTNLNQMKKQTEQEIEKIQTKEREMCECGHTYRWHKRYGNCSQPTCKCKLFEGSTKMLIDGNIKELQAKLSTINEIIEMIKERIENLKFMTGEDLDGKVRLDYEKLKQELLGELGK